MTREEINKWRESKTFLQALFPYKSTNASKCDPDCSHCIYELSYLINMVLEDKLP